jgi:hypothetical protein
VRNAAWLLDAYVHTFDAKWNRAAGEAAALTVEGDSLQCSCCRVSGCCSCTSTHQDLCVSIQRYTPWQQPLLPAHADITMEVMQLYGSQHLLPLYKCLNRSSKPCSLPACLRSYFPAAAAAAAAADLLVEQICSYLVPLDLALVKLYSLVLVAFTTMVLVKW